MNPVFPFGEIIEGDKADTRKQGYQPPKYPGMRRIREHEKQRQGNSG
jgi:hypothetical protein